MLLPHEFVASATGLECYLSCPRRFRQKYIDRLPASLSDKEAQKRFRRGDLFHKLVVWDSLEMDIAPILAFEEDDSLSAIWECYTRFQETLAANGATVEHEQVLTAHCNGIAVTARLDALVTAPDGSITIYDWKTGSFASSFRLVNHPQSQVYPWVVQQVRKPPSLRLVYWFPEQPDEPLHIECTPGYLQDATAWLTDLLTRITGDREFAMTPNRKVCRTCEYLAHCGVTAEAGDDYYLDEDFHAPYPDDHDTYDDPLWMVR